MNTPDDGGPQIAEETYRKLVELTRVGNRAVHRAQEENRDQGIPNVYSIRGHIYYEQPDGTLTLEDPGPETSASATDVETEEGTETG